MLLLMTVEPRFGGAGVPRRGPVEYPPARKLIARSGGKVLLQVSGDVSTETIERAAEAAAVH